MFENLWNLLLAIVGFGLVIFVHELGHFLAARWAGVRVHAFAIGFGQAIFSYRKGTGLRAGSSESEYLDRLKEAQRAAQAATPDDKAAAQQKALETVGLSPTEYRLNWFPFGGYVKMLGQEDGDASATSKEPDSYTQATVPKRMVIISAGVVMNIIFGALVFMGVYGVGKLEMPAIAGAVSDDSPAAQAGILPGDRVLAVDGSPVPTFQSLFTKTALASTSEPLSITIEREGEAEPIQFLVTPERSDVAGMPIIGVAPSPGAQLGYFYSQDFINRVGLEGFAPGDVLTAVNGEPITELAAFKDRTVRTATPLREALRASNGKPITATFATPPNAKKYARDTGVELTNERTVTLTPQPILPDTGLKAYAGKGDLQEQLAFNSILGLAPVMKVAGVAPVAEKQGLKEGDVFIKIGSIDLPGFVGGMDAIRQHAGGTVQMTVLRDGELVELSPKVSAQGTVGFNVGLAYDQPFVASLPRTTNAIPIEQLMRSTPSGMVIEEGPSLNLFGKRVLSINEKPVESFSDIARELQAASAELIPKADAPIITFEVEPLSDETQSTEQATLWPSNGQLHSLANLEWTHSSLLAFAPAEAVMQADSPLEAVSMGFSETRNWVARTYVTFARVADGSVSPTSLRGPVGIADIGRQVAERGLIDLLFLLALISINLAVINFLPFPILDGGHMVMLAYEGIFKKPVPIAVLNLLTLVALFVIMTLFVLVTGNDILRILRQSGILP